jgi:hypothetical protein
MEDTLTRKEAERRDPLLYRDIQRAYEHILSVAGNTVQGDTATFLARLYERRARSVLLIQPPERPGSTDFDHLGSWFRDARAQKVSEMIAGSLDDIWIGNDSPDLFRQEGERLRDEFDSDRSTIRELGIDCYATYLPIHFFFGGNRSDTDWGIYISEQGMMRLAAVLQFNFTKYVGPLPDEDESRFVALAYQVLLRHELEHFKVESFALNAEMFVGRPVYVPYLLNVYAQLYGDAECLEEALANATVTHSRVINDLVRDMYRAGPGTDRSTPDWQGLVEHFFFDLQPGGYSNYRLLEGFPGAEKSYGQSGASGEDSPFRQAMNHLCNQMLAATPQPGTRVPFYAFPPDNFFLRAENLVPIHIVRYLKPEDSFIQLATPTRQIWEPFLRELGFRPTERGKGDHVVWRSTHGVWPDITLNYHGKELDFNSFKSTLRTLKIDVKQFNYYHTHRRLPESLAQQIAAA